LQRLAPRAKGIPAASAGSEKCSPQVCIKKIQTCKQREFLKEFLSDLAKRSLGPAAPHHPPSQQNLPSQKTLNLTGCGPAVGSSEVPINLRIGLLKNNQLKTDVLTLKKAKRKL